MQRRDTYDAKPAAYVVPSYADNIAAFERSSVGEIGCAVFQKFAVPKAEVVQKRLVLDVHWLVRR